MSDNRTRDEIRADVIVSHFLGDESVPDIPSALRLSEQIARALTEAELRGYRQAVGDCRTVCTRPGGCIS